MESNHLPTEAKKAIIYTQWRESNQLPTAAEKAIIYTQ